MNTRNLTLLLPLIFASCGNNTKKESTTQSSKVEIANNKIISIKDIVGKTKEEVANLLGKSEKAEKVKPSNTPCAKYGCDKIFYQGGKFEVVFINDKADWITINNTSEYSLDDNAITLLGLNQSKATFKNVSSVIRWEQIEGINEISFFNNGSNKVDYIYVKGFTK